MIQRSNKRSWRLGTGAALFALLLGIYMLSMSGHTYSSDEETMLAGGEFLLDTGSFSVPKGDLRNLTTGIDGRTYSKYGPGVSLAVVPFVVAGRAAATLAPPLYERMIVRLFVLLLPALVTAAAGVVLYAWSLELGFSRRVALATGLIFGLTSLIWPYGRTLFAETPAAFFLALCGYGLRRRERRWWAVAGAAAVGALAAKFQSGLALPLLALYALLVSVSSRADSSAGQPGVALGRWRVALGWGGFGGRTLWGLLGAALPMGLLMAFNQIHFGGPLKSGYGTNDVSMFFGETWTDGLYGLTLSTGKGLLFFSPTILLGFAGMLADRRRQWRESLLALAVLAVHLYVYSQITYWHGDGSWGPRYLVFTLPFLYLPVAGLLARVAEQRQQVARWAIGVLAALGLVVQLLPVLVNFDTYILLSNNHARFFDPARSPLLAHPQIWLARMRGAWERGHPPANTALLVDGFSYSEGDRSKGEVLPRWTNADAAIQVAAGTEAPLQGTIVLGDHRPWPLPRAEFELLLDDAPLPNVQRIDLNGQSIDWELRFEVPAAQARAGALLVLHSSTWNPTVATQDNPRNEDLGVLVQRITLQQNGQTLALRESLPVGPPQNSRRAVWNWYQDTPNNHLFDVWLWYLYAARMPASSYWALVALIGLPGLALLLLGARGVWPTLRRGGMAQRQPANAPAPPTRPSTIRR